MARGAIYGYLQRLLALDDTPERIATAFSIGVFLAFSPLLGLHTILGLAIAFIFRLNRAAVLIGVFVSNPWTIVPIYTAGAYLGWHLFGSSTPPVLPDLRLANLWHFGYWRDVLFDEHILKTLVLGSTILSFVAAGVSYPLALWVIRGERAYRARHKHGIL